MTDDVEMPEIRPQQSMTWKQVLGHWTLFIFLMTALIGGAALIF